MGRETRQPRVTRGPAQLFFLFFFLLENERTILVKKD